MLSTSKIVLQRQLDFTIVVSRGMDDPKRTGTVSDIWIRQRECGMVKGIEKLAAKLQILLLPDWKIFHQREIPYIRIRADQSVTARISEGIFCRNRICAGIEP